MLKLKNLRGWALLIVAVFLAQAAWLIILPNDEKAMAEIDFVTGETAISCLSIMEESVFLAQAPVPKNESPDENSEVKKSIKVIVTAYSSSPWETQGDPFITASGTRVRDGIVANNLLAFGTKIKLPELFGDKIFVVEDRMNSRKGYYHVDIWFPSREAALNFGSRLTEMEVLAYLDKN